jgi:hypothetical protein
VAKYFACVPTIDAAVRVRLLPLPSAVASASRSTQTASEPPDVAVAVQPSNRCAEGLIEVGHWPSVLYIRMDHHRYSRPHKCKFHLWPGVESRTALPGSLKVSLFDWATKFRYEPLHEDTLVPDWSLRLASEVLGHDERQAGCGAESPREKFR